MVKKINKAVKKAIKKGLKNEVGNIKVELEKKVTLVELVDIVNGNENIIDIVIKPNGSLKVYITEIVEDEAIVGIDSVEEVENPVISEEAVAAMKEIEAQDEIVDTTHPEMKEVPVQESNISVDEDEATKVEIDDEIQNDLEEHYQEQIEESEKAKSKKKKKKNKNKKKKSKKKD